MVVKVNSLYVRQAPFINTTTGYPQDLTNTYTKTPVFLTRTRDGTSLPRWRDVIRAGGSATTGMTGVEETLRIFTDGTGYKVHVTEDVYNPQTNKYETSVSDGQGQFVNADIILNNPVISLSSATNQARSRFLDAVRQQNTHMQAGVLLGELRETCRGIGNVATKLANLTEKYLAVQKKFIRRVFGNLDVKPNGSVSRASAKKPKHLKPTDWAKYRKELSDNWLQFSFGARPLLADTVDLAETFARHQYDEVHTKVRGYGEAKAYISSASVNLGGLFKATVIGNDAVTERAEVILRGGLVFSLQVADFGSAERLKDLLGFKLEDFAPTMWNLLPYSFLVDYFSNVGQIWSAITTDTSAVRWVNVSERRIRKYQRHAVASAQQYVNKSSSGGGYLGGY
jgi:hypothetical protein